SELVALDELKDRRVPAFLAKVPGDVDPEALRGTGHVRFTCGGVTYLGGYRGLEEPVAVPRWLVCLVLPEDDGLAAAKKPTRVILAVAVAGVLGAGVLSLGTAGQGARPLGEPARDAEARRRPG